MTFNLQEKINLSNIRIEKAHSNLKDAKNSFNEGRYSLTINRSYYAILSASRSLLILKGIDSFRILLARRTDVDYGDFSEPTAEEAEDSLKKSRDFVAHVELALTRLKSEQC